MTPLAELIFDGPGTARLFAALVRGPDGDVLVRLGWRRGVGPVLTAQEVGQLRTFLGDVLSRSGVVGAREEG